jgi:Mlc titration factor MtfA (ptsG expression regulator)
VAFLLFLGLIFAGFLVWLIYKRILQYRRSSIYKKPLPDGFIHILRNNVSHYQHLPEDLKSRLHGLINVFLEEKVFIGCAGLHVTDEMRLTIAGNACLLLLNLNRDYYPGFTSILIYPDTYVAQAVTYDGTLEHHHDSVRAGESWHLGPVVLSWSDVVKGITHKGDGHNVVLHEFAHKLDEENSIMDGLPILRDSTQYREWKDILGSEYESLSIRVKKGKNTVLDEYATSSPPEFFAVATESFFEKSAAMNKKLPELYEQLSKYYGLDPIEWYLEK